MKKKLYLFIVLVFGLSSCSTHKFVKTDNDFIFNKIFRESGKTYLYRTYIEIFDKSFTGITVIKPGKDKTETVFINELGMKFFDFEIFPDEEKIRYIFEPANKKAFVKLLTEDFRLMTMLNFNTEGQCYIEKKTENHIVKIPETKKICYINKETGLPEKIIKYSLVRKNVIIMYEKYKNNIPEIIKVEHKKIKINMNFKLM